MWWDRMVQDGMRWDRMGTGQDGMGMERMRWDERG